ncbi:MAG: acyltransferase [Chthoniobacterales bacterium]|nr:acyltransferase [Chthoniobacterales bacterium]
MNRSLNSFRAFAFMAVFGFHTAVLGNGYLGVNAFFVLSGFLLIPILRQTKATTSSAREFCVNFYGRRALRIFPAYYLFLLLIPLFIAIVQLPLGDLFMKQLPWALTYTYDFYHASSAFQRNGMLAHLWSLAVEEQFYIVFPFVVLFASDKLLKWGFVVLMALGPVIRGTIWVVADTHLLPFVFREPDVVVYLLPFSHVDAFVTGGFFAVYLRGYVPTTKLLLSSFAALIALGLETAKLATESWDFASLATRCL